MFKPVRRYRRKSLSIKHTLFLTIVIFTLLTSFGLWTVNEKMKPAVMGIAVTQAEQLGSYAINYGIGESVLTNASGKSDPNPLPDIDFTKLIVMNRNDQGEISDYSLNPAEASRIKGVISNRILWFIRSAEKGKITLTNGPGKDLEYVKNGHSEGIVADIPLGQILNNALISNYGPRVPVEMDVVSKVQTDIRWDFKNIGINNIIFMAYLDVKVKVDIIVPFDIKTETISQHVPIGSNVLPKDVPYFYSSGGSGLTPSVPVAPQQEKKSSKNKE